MKKQLKWNECFGLLKKTRATPVGNKNKKKINTPRINIVGRIFISLEIKKINRVEIC